MKYFLSLLFNDRLNSLKSLKLPGRRGADCADPEKLLFKTISLNMHTYFGFNTTFDRISVFFPHVISCPLQ